MTKKEQQRFRDFADVMGLLQDAIKVYKDGGEHYKAQILEVMIERIKQ